jgi:hypothetical protein
VVQNDRVNIICRDRQRLPVAFPPFLGALKHSAVNQQLKSTFSARIRTRIYEMLGTGNCAGGAQELNVSQCFLREPSDTNLGVIADRRFVDRHAAAI